MLPLEFRPRALYRIGSPKNQLDQVSSLILNKFFYVVGDYQPRCTVEIPKPLPSTAGDSGWLWVHRVFDTRHLL